MGPLYFLLSLFASLGLTRDSSSPSGGTSKSAEFVSRLPEDVEDETDRTPPPAPQEPDEPINPVEPVAPEQPGDGGTGGETNPTLISDGTVEVMGGRVATLAPANEDVVSLRIINGVEHGTVTVNPDNTFALVMSLSDFTGSQSFSYEATHADGSVTIHEVGLNVTPGLQEGGWGTGSSHYMLATDENDRVIVEHGDTHTKVYVSGSEAAWSLQEIAAAEGMAVEKITGDWLKSHGGYGQSEDMALDSEAGMKLWFSVTPSYSQTSNWLLFEKGYEYSDLGRIVERGVDGEDETHPLYFGSWGDGEKPVIDTRLYQFQDGTANVVFQDLHFAGGVFLLDVDNWLFDDVVLTESLVVQNSSGITVHNSAIYDAYRDAPPDGKTWEDGPFATQGAFMDRIDGLLFEGNFVDHSGWADGYEDGSAQAPNMFSHNLYFAENNLDVTISDTISMRASSYGGAIRSGGFLEDNVFLDNNAGLYFSGGMYAHVGNEWIGNYTLANGNVITSGAQKEAYQIGARSFGLTDEAQLTTLVDNIIAHMADPNNPDELLDKSRTDSAFETLNPYYNDTMVYHWYGTSEPFLAPDENVEGLDTSVLDQTTIQLFTAQLLGRETATIDDLANFLRAQAHGAFDDLVDADLIIRFFQEGFGIAPDLRADATTLRFVPNDLGDGVRWDNRLNWETEDLPGTQDGDSVDLGGNHVIYGGTAEIDTLDFGPGGQLDFYHGKLTAKGGLLSDTEGRVEISEAGQLWTAGSGGDGTIGIDVAGGRFANTGTMENADLTATGGQTILATGGAEYDVAASKTLAVFAAAAKVGFDGDDGGMAILDMHEGSILAYAADDGGLGTIEEFRSGAFGDAPNVQSGIDLGGASLEIDLTGLSAAAGAEFMLMDADELVGVFNDPSIGGLGARDATIVVDYVNDSVTLKLSAGTGLVTVETLGEENDVTAGEEDLWAALTADQGLAEDQPLPEEEEMIDVAA